jgi:hypothetical protein
MPRHLKPLFAAALGLSLTLVAACLPVIGVQYPKEAIMYDNSYTHQKYATMEDSLKATRDYFNQDLARVTPLREPLKCKALIIIPSDQALTDYWDKCWKKQKESMEMEVRVRMPDYDKMKEKYPRVQQVFTQMEEANKRNFEHSAKTDEIRYDFLVEALKRRKIFQDTGVQKAREMGTAHPAVPSGYGVVIYLISMPGRGSGMPIQNLWYLGTPGSADPVMIGTDESVNQWLTGVEKTAGEQLQSAKP